MVAGGCFGGNNSRRTWFRGSEAGEVIQTMYLRLDLVNGIVIGLYFITTSENIYAG